MVFLVLDAAWLLTMYDRLYRPAIGHLLRDGFALAPAAAFYALYILGVVVFAVLPGQSERARLGGRDRAVRCSA